MRKTTKDIYMYVLGAIVVIGMFAITYMLIMKQVPEDNSSVFYMLTGQLAAGFLMVLGYFFGTSKSSTDKTDILAKAEPIKES